MLTTMEIKADGTKFTVSPAKGNKFSLKELQDSVNGFIEIIRLDSSKAFLVINEEGKLIDLPINETATWLYQNEYDTHDYIVGDVLIAQYNQID